MARTKKTALKDDAKGKTEAKRSTKVKKMEEEKKKTPPPKAEKPAKKRSGDDKDAEHAGKKAKAEVVEKKEKKEKKETSKVSEKTHDKPKKTEREKSSNTKKHEQKETNATKGPKQEADAKNAAKEESKKPLEPLPIVPRRVSGKSPPESSASFCMTPTPRRPPCPSPDASPTELSVDNIRHWKEKAAERGLSLEDYMEEISAEAMTSKLEDHMLQLVLEEEQAAYEKKQENEKKQKTKSTGKAEKDNKDEERDEEEKDKTGQESEEDGDESSDLDSKESSSEEDEEDDEEEETGAKPVQVQKLASDAGSDESEEDDQKEGEEEEAESSEEEELDEDAFETKLDEMMKPGGRPSALKNKNAEKTKQAENEAALVQAVQKQQSVQPDFASANSKSHKVEWDRFNRQCMDRRRFPQSLAAVYLKDKLDLFRSWLQCAGDWDKSLGKIKELRVTVIIDRKASKSTLNRCQREGMKKRDILKKYPTEKANQLMKALKGKGLYYDDPDFPGDEEEIFYYVGSGNIVRTDDRTSEEVGVQIKDKGNQDLVNALTSPDGPLVNGLQPGMAVANEQGAKSLVEAINAEGKAEKKKNKGSNPNKSERCLQAKMDACLKKSADARKHAIALGPLDYGGDLAGKLLAFSEKMEKVWKKIQDLRTRKITNESAYENHISILDDKLAAANGLLKGLKPKKAKAKAKAKAADKEEAQEEENTTA